MSSGYKVFPTLAAAINAGYSEYDRKARTVRTKTARGWALALVTAPW